MVPLQPNYNAGNKNYSVHTKKQTGTKRIGYIIGIGIGIIIVTAFIFSQMLFPLILGRTPKVEVPSVTGMPLIQAKKLLQEEKLHVIVQDSLFSDVAAPEVVLEQSPLAGEKLRQDGTVYLVISKGSSTVTLPSLIGKPFQEAFIVLKNLDLHCSVVDSTYSDIYPVNTVIRSIPSTGEKTLKKSTVKLILSKGSEPVPDTLNYNLPIYY
ncbi:MAG TPA: PASTA domain-containing protein [Candidatus Cloacimonas sp.]|nr:PASTA domain-containing protein [Candidatus Cloacimonas sp.]